MTVEVRSQVDQSVTVKASPEQTWALLADVPASAAHFPGLEALEPVEGGYAWRFQQVGAGSVAFQLLYGSRYAQDEARGTIRWSAIEGLGNGRTEGGWTIAPSGSGATLRLENQLTITLPLPKLLQPMVQALVARENERLIASYLENIKTTLDGGDGRVRKTPWF